MSGPVGAIERAIESIVERPVARLFRLRVQPEQVLRALERAADAAAGPLGRRPVPGSWVVRVEPGSPLLVEPDRSSLEVWLTEAFRRAVVGRGRAFTAHPSVHLVGDPGVGRAGVVVMAGSDADPADPSTAGAGLEADGPVSAPVGRVPADHPSAGARRAGSPPVLRLDVLLPGRPVRQTRVPVGDLSLGRGRTASVRLPHESVSRLHGRLTVRQGILVYVDLGSRNGSWLNGRPVTEAAVGEGDRIDLGAAAIVVAGLR